MRSKAVYLASSRILTRRASQKTTGSRDILGIWIEQTEGAKFWMKVFTDLKTRGCQDILIAVTDGLKGMSEALAAVFPDAQNAPTGGLGKTAQNAVSHSAHTHCHQRPTHKKSDTPM
jgi:mutator family transposase